MSHVDYELQELHAGQPNTLSIPILDDAGDPIDFGTGDAEEPSLTIVDLSGEEVATVPAQSGYWPFAMQEESDVWVAAFTTLAPGVGTRLRLLVTFTDPGGNEVTLPYPAIVVPPV